MKKILWKSGLVGSDFLMCGVILFLLGYLCIDVPKLHNNIFYGLVLFPLLFCAKKRHFIKLHGSLLVNVFFVFLFYSVCTVFWSEFYSEELLWRYFKRLLYIYGLFLAIYIIVISRPNFPSLFTISSVFILAVCAAGCVYLFSPFGVFRHRCVNKKRRPEVSAPGVISVSSLVGAKFGKLGFLVARNI